jgi:hypothetical protein
MCFWEACRAGEEDYEVRVVEVREPFHGRARSLKWSAGLALDD